MLFQLRGPGGCPLTWGWHTMRFTGTSSACSPRGPSASVTVHRSSFGALRGESRRFPGGPAPGPRAPPSKPASPAISRRGAGRASLGEAAAARGLKAP